MKWNFKRGGLLEGIAPKTNMSTKEIMAKILANRNIEEEYYDILRDDPLSLIESPYDITGAQKAAENIIEYIEKGKYIAVFADYDVDGLTSGFILTDYINSIGGNAWTYYPERKEGYGLNMNFCKEICKIDVDKAVITVDNGITKAEEINYLLKHDVAVTVTDHHEPQEYLPECVCCDPWLSKASAGHNLCGAGVAWMVCTIIMHKTGKGDVMKYLPYLAIGTVADVMPMDMQNQAIVSLGIKEINDNSPENIKTLLKKIGIKELFAKDIAWKIAPVLNAAGRMGSIGFANEFMFPPEGVTVADTVLDILALNDKRQAETKKAKEEILKRDFSNQEICFFNTEKYPEGIKGIIAGKLAEITEKPSVAYTVKEGQCGASVRNPYGQPFIDFLTEAKQHGLINSWGGHAQALGLQFPEENIELLQETAKAYLEECREKGILEPVEETIDIDTELDFAHCNTGLYKEIYSWAYDKENFTEPVFIIRNVNVSASQPYANKDHLVLKCKDSKGNEMTLVDWNGYPKYEELGKPWVVDMVGTIDKVGMFDKKNGRYPDDITFKIMDMKPVA